MGELVGVIDHEWAEEVANNAFDIWRFNRVNAEEIQGDISLRLLGGLAVVLGAQVYTAEEARYVASCHSTVNLAFDEPALITTTKRLQQHSLEQHGSDHELTRQLAVRTIPTHQHGGDERWFLPIDALRLAHVAQEVAAGAGASGLVST